MAGSMCMKGAVCATSSVGVKMCVASTMSAADGGAKLTFVLVALAAAMLA